MKMRSSWSNSMFSKKEYQYKTAINGVNKRNVDAF